MSDPKRYRTIVADPPWMVHTGSARGLGRGWTGRGKNAALDYPTMTVAEIAALPIAELAEDAAHLYCWTINRYVPQVYEVVQAWGFKPSTLLTWCKPPMGGGLGEAFGITTEHVLFARRGRLPMTSRLNTTWHQWPRVYGSRPVRPLHSAKPDAFYDLVESVSPGPRCELFARRARFGWDYWGDESLGTAEMVA